MLVVSDAAKRSSVQNRHSEDSVPDYKQIFQTASLKMIATHCGNRDLFDGDMPFSPFDMATVIFYAFLFCQQKR